MMGNRIKFPVSNTLNSRWAFLVLFANLVAIPAFADVEVIYKWLDAKGITQYTEHPPTDKDIEVVEIRTEGSDPAGAAEAREAVQKRVDDLDERRSDKKLAAEEGEQAVERRKQVQEFCDATKSRLAEFQSGRRLAEKQEDGSYVPVTEEQRAERISEMEADIKEQCSEL